MMLMAFVQALLYCSEALCARGGGQCFMNQTQTYQHAGQLCVTPANLSALMKISQSKPSRFSEQPLVVN